MTLREELNSIIAARFILIKLPVMYKDGGRGIVERAYEHLGFNIAEVRREMDVMYTVGFRADLPRPRPVTAPHASPEGEGQHRAMGEGHEACLTLFSLL
jgi:hypothetical protein